MQMLKSVCSTTQIVIVWTVKLTVLSEYFTSSVCSIRIVCTLINIMFTTGATYGET